MKKILFPLILMLAVGISAGCSKKASSVNTAVSAESAASEISESAASSMNEAESAKSGAESSNSEIVPAPDFELYDQFGKLHKLSDYKGSVVFLNFWATWCPPCRKEMPDIQALYDKYKNSEDDSVTVLGVAAPNMGNEGSVEDIKAFLEENSYSYPVLMDTDGELFSKYYISSYPTTFMIDKEGNIHGYVPGMLNSEMIDYIVDQTLNK